MRKLDGSSTSREWRIWDGTDEDRKKIGAWARTSQNTARLQAMIKMAKSERDLSACSERPVTGSRKFQAPGA